ncbi:hypothetical protein CC86DRAFT_425927 [Ophiobolus disseminans]|uniref:Non-specific serine/threonine protein kinase n=1 Tax=Ophiobolus disseminans TaxID=1469910 RepID=A0A6A6ZN77_9PLEO|nr:hypothetical protein CC86DRAFT_425927 [Ophiobolus disseminans]
MITSLADYTVICEFDSGVCAHVNLCVQTSLLYTARDCLVKDKENVLFDQLISNARAVKMYKSEEEIPVSERNTFLDIRRQTTDENGGNRIVQTPAYDQATSTPRWLMLSILPACCTLRDFFIATPDLPYQFAWLLFLELYPMLKLMQQSCHPPIIHDDLCSGNILVGFKDASMQGPIVFLTVDLGNAGTATPPNSDVGWDTRAFNKMIVGVGQESTDKKGTGSGCEDLDRYLRVHDRTSKRTWIRWERTLDRLRGLAWRDFLIRRERS